MVSLNIKELIQPVSFTVFAASAIALVATTTTFNDAKIASAATFTGTLSGIAFFRNDKKVTQVRLKDELESAQRTLSQLEKALSECQESESNLLSKIKPYVLVDGTLFDMSSQSELIASMRDNLARLGERLQTSETSLLGVKSERDSLKLDSDRLNGLIVALEASKAEYVKKFDDQGIDDIKKVDALNSQIKRLETENTKFEAQFSSIEEVAKLRANVETSALKDKLKELDDQYVRVATLYNSAVTDLKALNAEYVAEFSELNEAVSKGLPEAFEAVLNSRDQEMLRMSGYIQTHDKPLMFHSIGEFERANRLIQALYEGKPSITLDRGQIVPYDDKTGFDVYLQLRNGQAVGNSFIEPLNELGNDLAVKCCCIKDLKFEVDRINPHRIKTAMVFRKAQKVEPKSALSKDWIQADQFERVYKLLKKPMTRVMGSTGEGKGIFVNLLLAIEANQPVPTFTRLHDPMDGSSEDYWQIPKISKGKTESLIAVKIFADEFENRLENSISEPKTLDVFDEVDIVADTTPKPDPSVNSRFLTCAKGMRHNGMKGVLIGQSPSVAKKGMEWADMDNFNAVYFGAAIKTALDKTPSLEDDSEKLKKTYKRLKEFCHQENEEYGLEDSNLYRVGLLVTGGKATFFELPSADSIACDWSKLSQKPEFLEATLESKSEAPTCSECDSENVKPYRGSHTNKEGLTTRYLKCADCNHKFTA